MSDRLRAADEQLRLEQCSREPIRTPGRIQSHGMLFVVDNSTHEIVVASENARRYLGTRLDHPQIVEALDAGTVVDPVRVTFDDEQFDAIIHPGDTTSIVELEQTIVGVEYARTSVVSAIQRLAFINDPEELRNTAAELIRSITGFDRVMVYHFHDDGHGEVVAESRADDMAPYLGLHFPASDIPSQARHLYTTKLSRAIVSTEDPGLDLLADSIEPMSIDLGATELRMVSPYHLAYMRNMGQASTVSFSKVKDGVLIGMITCAHRTPRRLPILLRRALEVLATQLAFQLDSMEKIRVLRHEVEVRERRAALLSPLFASDDVMSALLRGSATVLDLVPADGVAVRHGDKTYTLGTVPPATAIRAVMDAVGDNHLASHVLGRVRPDLAELIPDYPGLIVVPLGSGDCITFFRRAITHVVDWLGDPGPQNRADALSPRLSFEAWRESVADSGDPWGSAVQEAIDLGEALKGAMARRAEARLAELALHDALTGLRNRRFLAENLERALVERQQADSVSLLFLDLDGFKSVNDSYGHDAGDAVIVEVARRIVANSRTADAVARLGGDEFVIVCEHTTPQEAHLIAERIVRAVGKPIDAKGVTVTVTASCGIVTADDASSGARLLEAADAAMYRAKAEGRNRVAT
ncbi:chemotaxis family two-component system sensor kinase Cph1 [Microbacteriaceae bacterium SG_E_30_P1]|uniref:Chemotaxis family two-component system sensor kinase Cph1 n=1 Tax=Antiquaquibacter oligotrophicus TaxID=2880260 RepID=A0ABT6KL75_9MICO|nr:sensor domain-containing diguanylate cyclase [Antiquaquibacter oligotrophicus]MDH6180203.1 chemotaxis family two-component system sensor kinase Cph1 [Antiquaquibacter oligotrophicus]UDF14050.1 diguanylate cyclase [Antiquaquibacter oligotrophicus]